MAFHKVSQVALTVTELVNIFVSNAREINDAAQIMKRLDRIGLADTDRLVIYAFVAGIVFGARQTIDPVGVTSALVLHEMAEALKEMGVNVE